MLAFPPQQHNKSSYVVHGTKATLCNLFVASMTGKGADSIMSPPQLLVLLRDWG
jgi:hypothetical protein